MGASERERERETLGERERERHWERERERHIGRERERDFLAQKAGQKLLKHDERKSGHISRDYF